MNPQNLSDLLQEHGLNPAKWVPIFENENITKPDHVTVITGSSEDYEELSSKADTEEEQRSLRKLLHIPDATNTADEEIEKMLDNAGLDASHWLSIFKAQLGVRTPQALQCIGSESYSDLERFTNKPQEKKALRKFLEIENEETGFKSQRVQQVEKLRKRQERSQQVLKELKELQKEGKGRHNSAVKQLENGICEALQIPEKESILHEESLEQLTGNLEIYTEQLSGKLTTTMDVSDVKVLESASGGRALQGVLVSRKYEEQLEAREKLLQVPEDAQFLMPTTNQHENIEEFSYVHHEVKFTKSMDKLGFSVAVSAKASFHGLGVEVSPLHTNATEEETSKKHHSQELYKSTIRYSFIPMASFHFKNSQLLLSLEAMNDLKAIEALVLSNESESALQHQCELFFHKYGSHAIKGPLNLGGIYWWKSYSQGFQESEITEVKNLQNEVITASVCLTYGRFGAFTEVDMSNLSATLHGTFSESLIRQTHVKVTKTGGPQEVSDIPQWKNGLVASNSTWSVIDRGDNTVPVWKIIQMNHWTDFRDPRKLIQILTLSWERMTKLQAETTDGELLLQGDEDFRDLLEEVSEWNQIKDPTKCQEHLKLLSGVRLDLVKKSMTPHTWPALYLSKAPIQMYLKWVVEAMQDGSDENSGYIKILMQQLLNPSDLKLVKNFPGKHSITKWLYCSDQADDIIPLECKDFLSLQAYIKQALDDMTIATAKRSTQLRELAEKQESRLRGTKCVARAVNHLRNHLHEANQTYEDLFIITLLYPFRYKESEMIFRHPLHIGELEYLSKEVEKQSIDFFRTKAEGLEKLQAFLFHLVVSFSDSEVNIDFSEPQTKRHLQYLQDELKDQLDIQIEDILNGHPSLTDWKALQYDLSNVITGVIPVQKREGPALEEILKEVPSSTDPSDTEAQCFKPDEQPHPKLKQTRSCPKMQQFEDFLDLLGLEKYYPQKMTLADAVCIRAETLGNLQYTEQERSLPFYILQKIMMHNYKSRTILLRKPVQQKYPSISKGQPSADSEEDDDSEDEDSEDGVSTPSIHPMDGLLALMHCADNFLRQDLIAKLSTCKLAIPFLLPDPCTQTVALPLWGMRSMVKEWKCKSHGEAHQSSSKSSKVVSRECRIVECKMPIVSFLRFSESETSKSKMLNDIIGDSEHDFFFHWDCEGGSAKQVLVDGVVELCWYLPAGKETDHFSDIVTFTNLHGDARQHELQSTFLSKVSFMNFVLLTQNDMDDKGMQVLQSLAEAPGGLVLIFSDARDEDKVKMPKKALPRKKYSKMKVKKKNAATIKNEIREHITGKLEEQKSVCTSRHFMSITDCAEIANQMGIDVDEKSPKCIEGKQLAQTLLKEILVLDTDSDSTAGVKDTMLPLQGQKMWHTWAKHDKEQHRHLNRGSKGIEQYNSLKDEDKLTIRKKQLKLANPPTPVMRSFILSLLQHKGILRNYFLQWLKLLLDDRSRDKLPHLHKQYQAKRKEIMKLKEQKDEDSTELTILKDEMKRLNDQLIHTSFGLEHLLRELGQMYESVWDVSQMSVHSTQIKPVSRSLQSKVFRLPSVAAELLAAGYPLELMDGDASHVPLTWVMAVLEKVKETLGDAKLFVLSVLGIQSTGKSTLMNTMFGLQFAVSAGRCTRGAFMQLLPFDEKVKQEVKFDYLLIVDTEGLRAPELDSTGTQKHDNEMATFVIGLADVTIINIFGETPGDMDDILQTAVHAFLRMKKVKLKPSCQFVHQNVTAISAGSKGQMGRHKFQEKLDQMTKEAAKEEQCEGEYRSFKDVIQFDDETDVWYFPSLWKGDPPMAPVNPGYSDRAQNLKSRLIVLAQNRGSQCSLSDFQSRIKDLWEAVLHENFIFSFKNTLEITAYNELDAEYGQWSWTLQRTMLDWEHETENMVRSSEFEKLRHLQKERIEKAQRMLQDVHHDLKKKMQEFFEGSKHSEILTQWLARTEIRLDELRLAQEKQVEEHCRALIRSREAHFKVENMQNQYREELQKHVKVLVSEQEGKKLDDTELRKLFEEKWKDWMQDFTARMPEVYQSDVNIDTSVVTCLRDFLRHHDGKVIQKLMHKPLQKWGRPLQLLIGTGNYLKSRRWIRGVQDSDREHAQRKTQEFLDKAKQYLEELKGKKIQNFNDAFLYELLKTVIETINQFNKEKHDYEFTQDYKVDLALTVGGYASHHFEAMMKAVRKENDPVEYLKTLKVPFFTTFKSQYFQIAKEKIAADNLCYLLEKPIEMAVIASLVPMVVEDMRAQSTFHSKRSLNAQILLDLKKESFSKYALYLTDMKQSLQTWIRVYTEQYCSQISGGKSRLAELAEGVIKRNIFFITKAAKDATESLPVPERPNINEWIGKFHEQLTGKLVLDERELKEVVGVEQLTDFEFFTQEAIKGLRKVQQIVDKKFQTPPASQMETWSKKPYNILSDTMLGCCEQCPFCKAQCELITPQHDTKHSIELHHPQCLGGYRWSSSGKLTIDVCSADVASNNTFQNERTNHKPHPYNNFDKVYPEWSISPDSSSQASLYWKWFVVKYSAEIVKLFNARGMDELPSNWKTITWEEVKEDLKKRFDL